MMGKKLNNSRRFTFTDGEVDEIYLMSEEQIIQKINQKDQVTPCSSDSFQFYRNNIHKK
jgi:hypothetical protein